jgi:hypothetical protein
MAQQFGKRNRPTITKPERVKVRKRPSAATTLPGKSRFYILVGAALLVMIVGGYALAV